MKELTIVQAYARAQNLNANQAEKDWLDEKDFKILGGPYFSARDRFAMHKDGITKLVCVDRYCKVLFVVDLDKESKTAGEYEGDSND
jgi:hypothetical protein